MELWLSNHLSPHAAQVAIVSIACLTSKSYNEPSGCVPESMDRGGLRWQSPCDSPVGYISKTYKVRTRWGRFWSILQMWRAILVDHQICCRVMIADEVSACSGGGMDEISWPAPQPQCLRSRASWQDSAVNFSTMDSQPRKKAAGVTPCAGPYILFSLSPNSYVLLESQDNINHFKGYF